MTCVLPGNIGTIKVFILFYRLVLIVLFALNVQLAFSQSELDRYNILWTTQSKNSGESMPCGGGDIGLNVWVENGELLIYAAKSGSFDENNALMKAGRLRMRLSSDPFNGKTFKQELHLRNGFVTVEGENNGAKVSVKIWVDVFTSTVHIDINSNKNIRAEAAYESWRYQDRLIKPRENFGNSWKWAPPVPTVYKSDKISFITGGVMFYHQNDEKTIFDATVAQQGMDAVKDQLYNPLKHLVFGGYFGGKNFIPSGNSQGEYVNTDFRGWLLKSKKPAKSHSLTLTLYNKQGSVDEWGKGLDSVLNISSEKNAYANTQNWWKQFWDRSFIYIDSAGNKSQAWEVGRNYQLFRYMLACNAFGGWPTKFNGGLLTVDPVFTDTSNKLTPDYRNWGGGLHTMQNQRLVYYPAIKNGDWDILQAQLKFYLRILKNAELRSKVYWSHNGACFTEQMENFGLPNYAEYGQKRPPDFDKGVEYNAWLEYEWDTVLEFCLMMLEEERYTQKNISSYIPFIESCLRFFDEHYQYRAKQRGIKALDGNGQLVLYPGSGAETFKMAYNSTSTIAALKTITGRLLQLPENYLPVEKRMYLDSFYKRIPPISFTEFNGHTTIAPAKMWERINNTETSQLYPVFPWGMYGVGKPDLDIAVNTYRNDTNAIKFRSHVGWKQDNIFAARLGLTDEAARLTSLKLKNSGRRFPAFWGPGFDWVPDHNWGGSGMIGLQEMLLQVDGEKIYLLPAWPKNWDVHFKLHAPYQTTVEATVRNGKIENINVFPESRRKDIINMFKKK